MSKIKAGGIFIVKKDGTLLVCHPTNHSEDFWSIPKGKVDVGETMIECAIRETYEETNLDVNSAELKEYFDVYELDSVNYGHKKKILYPFLYLEKDSTNIDWSDLEIKCNSNVPEERGGFPEMDGYKWVTLDEAKSILHNTQVFCLDKIKNILNGKN